jgi:hypothetical protein
MNWLMSDVWFGIRSIRLRLRLSLVALLGSLIACVTGNEKPDYDGNGGSKESKPAALRVEGNKLTLLIEGKAAKPVTQIPLSRIDAVRELSFALVGIKDTYHVFTYASSHFDPTNGVASQLQDLGSTGAKFDSENPQPPSAISLSLRLSHGAIIPMIPGQRPRPIQSFVGQELSFGIVSHTSYWWGCHAADRRYHYYTSDGLGSTADYGHVYNISC